MGSHFVVTFAIFNQIPHGPHFEGLAFCAGRSTPFGVSKFRRVLTDALLKQVSKETCLIGAFSSTTVNK